MSSPNKADLKQRIAEARQSLKNIGVEVAAWNPSIVAVYKTDTQRVETISHMQTLGWTLISDDDDQSAKLLTFKYGDAVKSISIVPAQSVSISDRHLFIRVFIELAVFLFFLTICLRSNQGQQWPAAILIGLFLLYDVIRAISFRVRFFPDKISEGTFFHRNAWPLEDIKKIFEERGRYGARRIVFLLKNGKTKRTIWLPPGVPRRIMQQIKLHYGTRYAKSE